MDESARKIIVLRRIGSIKKNCSDASEIKLYFLLMTGNEFHGIGAATEKYWVPPSVFTRGR